MFRRIEAEQTLFFLHIPKTGGTSIVSQLADLHLRWLHIYWPVLYPEIGARLGTARDRLRASEAEILAGDFNYVIGHFTQKDVIETLGPDPRFRYATMLRDPVRRIVSNYNYLLSPAHPEHEELQAKFPTLDHFLDVTTDTNDMAHYLELRRDEPLDEIVERVVESYAFLGLVEDFERSADDLHQCFGVRRERTVHLNRGPSTASQPRPDQIERITAMNARDVELYRRLAPRIRAG